MYILLCRVSDILLNYESWTFLMLYATHVVYQKTGTCDDVFWGGEPLCIRQEIKLNHFLLWMKKEKIPQSHSNPCHNQWIKTIGSICFYWGLFVLCHFMDESVVATTTTTGMTFGSVPLSPQVICCTLCIKVYDAFKSFKL